ncbi:hypothetical protein GA0070620_3096 [Micromonospora krabiensis]|uniref:Uncharacterized protein n=2 Tax=Micromonospora krabiensis TaxID=307121 RepID=A0A1C3N4Q5_9ACTN|nr:hypothetical protein GA0070620_3096 [Micromonospora krabiensis]
MDVKELIKQGRRPEDTVPLCLRADLVREYEQVEKQVTKARGDAGDSLAGPQVADLEARLADLRGQMAGTTLTLTLRALSPHRYQALVDEHPPRVNDGVPHSRDRVLGFNADTFFVALAKACIVSPDLDDEDWEALVGDDGTLTDGQVEKLCTTAWQLNKSEVNLPF